MLDIESCCLVVVDVQGKLAQLMYEKQILFKNIRILIQAAKILDIPIVYCQQKPEALGPTIPEIAELLTDIEPVNKISFSCCGDEKFSQTIQNLNRRQILLCGIETHVCIYQTVADLITKGCHVELIADAVSSRTKENKQLAIARMGAAGIAINSTEMALFELLKTAAHPKFKQIAKLVK
ncbi:MAG: hydrolase [Planctomycetes bacterium]|nr:hydrolase [Planctomycetota bacterium]